MIPPKASQPTIETQDTRMDKGQDPKVPAKPPGPPTKPILKTRKPEATVPYTGQFDKNRYSTGYGAQVGKNNISTGLSDVKGGRGESPPHGQILIDITYVLHSNF